MSLEFEPKLTSINKRELSPFMAKQLLYDYATEELDISRKKALVIALEQSPFLVKSLDDIIYGMTYCSHLKQTNMSPEIIQKFRTPKTWKMRLKKYKNLRQWNQNIAWIFEAVIFSVVILFLSLIIPWPKYLKLFLEKQNPSLFLSEITREAEVPTKALDKSATQPLFSLEKKNSRIETRAEIKSVDPEFTADKLMLMLPKLGASIEHRSLRKGIQEDLAVLLQVSIPVKLIDKLEPELKSLGQLTWILPPKENTDVTSIVFMELWVLKAESQKGIAPGKEENGE